MKNKGFLGKLISTGISLVADKATKDGETTLSSKRILNVAGTATIIGLAITQINANGITKENLILLGVGVAYSVGMAFVTAYSERKA